MILAEIHAKKVLLALQHYSMQLQPAERANVNRKLSIDLQAWVFRNFKTEGKLASPIGWAKHAPSTIQARARKIRGKKKRAAVRKLYRQGATRAQVAEATGSKYGGRFPILQDTGALRQSFLPFATADIAGVGAVQYVNFRGGKAPTDLAAVHEFGNKARNIPRRKMLPNKVQATEMALKVYQLHVKRMIGERKKT
jgi:phage gpG-like protein